MTKTARLVAWWFIYTVSGSSSSGLAGPFTDFGACERMRELFRDTVSVKVLTWTCRHDEQWQSPQEEPRP